jgi:hypothetical protein
VRRKQGGPRLWVVQCQARPAEYIAAISTCAPAGHPILACLTPQGFAAERRKRSGSCWFRFLRDAAVILILYVASYAVLSYTGGWVISETGHDRPVPGAPLAAADVYIWQPRYGRCEPFRNVLGENTLRADALGYLFAPLILLDQRFVHPTIPFTAPDGRDNPAPPYEDYHPLRANRFHGRCPYEMPPDEPLSN